MRQMSTSMDVQSSLMECSCFKVERSFSTINLCDEYLDRGVNVKHFLFSSSRNIHNVDCTVTVKRTLTSRAETMEMNGQLF